MTSPTIADRTFLRVQATTAHDIEALPYELVERKGAGHPDTMCDAIAERASRYYSQFCLEHFGRIAHHWFDKVLLFGGEANVDYGIGEMVRPYKVLFAGKGAYAVGETPIPLADILFRAAADTLAEVTTGFDRDRHLVIVNEIVDHQGAGRGRSRYRPLTADDLVAIGDPDLVSNDCNLLHAYAPLSRLESLVLETERMITGPNFKARFPDTGWDVKVFGSRRGEDFRLIVNMPFLAKDVMSLEHYFQRKALCQEAIEKFGTDLLGMPFELLVNPTDRNGRPYLTALGSVADTGDVGVVGRGNRLNGLITPMRSMSIEAPAGKNPLDHTGKLYGVLSQKLAEAIHTAIGKPVDTHIFTSKEAPLDAPDEIVVTVHGADPTPEEDEKIRAIVAAATSAIHEITTELVHDGVTMW